MTGEPSPLVSCIMPTRNRRRFLPQALRCFDRRTYRDAELIVIDDGGENVSDLCKNVEAVRYLRAPPLTTGAKLNLGIEAAAGGILQKIDDDDYYGPRFIESSIEHLRGRDPERTLVTRCCFLTLVGAEPVLRHSGQGWTTGGALCFHRDLWRRIPFRDLAVSEDSHFLRDHQPAIVHICDPEQYVVVRHGGNHWNAVRLRQSGEQIDTDAYLRTLEVYPKAPGDLLDDAALAFYSRELGWPATAARTAHRPE